MRQTPKNIKSDFLGDLEPLQGKRFRAEMDRRQISMSWLGGSFLTGLASVFLMGGALFAALDGRQNLAIPAQAYEKADDAEVLPTLAVKGSRPGSAPKIISEDPGNLMMVPTVSREGDQDVVKLKPFMHLSLPLAGVPKREVNYPQFDPLAMFSESGKVEPIAASADLIYGADVEGEISYKIEDFPFGDPSISLARRQSSADIETIVRNTAPNLSVGGTAVTSVTFFDPARFSSEDASLVSTPGFTITAENVSTLFRSYRDEYAGTQYEERFERVKSELPIALVLQESLGLQQSEAVDFANAIASNLASDNFLADDGLRMIFETRNGIIEKSEKLAKNQRLSRRRSSCQCCPQGKWRPCLCQ